MSISLLVWELCQVLRQEMRVVFLVDTLFLSKVGTASVLTPRKGLPDKVTPVPKLNGKKEPAR